MLAEKILTILRQDLAYAIASSRRTRDTERRQVARDLVDAYNGAQFKMLVEDVNSLYESQAARDHMTNSACYVNLVRWVIDESSCAFKQPPIIRVKTKGGKDLTDIWNVLELQGNLNTKMREAERYANLTNDALVEVAVRQSAMKTGGLPIDVTGPNTPDKSAVIVWNIYTPDRYAVEQDRDDPSRPYAFSLFFVLEDSEGKNAGQRQYGTITWSPEGVYIQDHNGMDDTNRYFPNGNNIYSGVFDLPASVMRSNVPLFGEFYGPNANDLLSIERQLNMLMTQLRVVERFQGFGQLVISNASENIKDKIAVGLMRPLLIESRTGEVGDAKFITPGAPIAELRADINHLIQQAAQRRGLNGNDFVAQQMKGGSGAAQSGVAKTVENMRLLEVTEDMQTLSLPWLQDMVKKTLLVARTWAKGGWVFDGVEGAESIPDYSELEVEVKFAERPKLDSLEQYQILDARIKRGLTSPVEQYMLEHPEIQSKEDAMAAMLENIKDSGTLNQASMAANPAPMAGVPVMGKDQQPTPAKDAKAAKGKAPDAGKVQDVLMAFQSQDLTRGKAIKMLTGNLGYSKEEAAALLDS